MNNNVDKNVIVLGIISVLILLIIIVIYECISNIVKDTRPNSAQSNGRSNNIQLNDIQLNDIQLMDDYINYENETIINYDMDKIYDPLIEPTRRPQRYSLPPQELRRIIDMPTRGYPDNYSLLGLLVKQKNDDNKEHNILKLFGREVYPGSVQWEYYTNIHNGIDPIKIPIEINKNELYQDDIVYIKTLGQKYMVQLHKYDGPKYYPDIL